MDIFWYIFGYTNNEEQTDSTPPKDNEDTQKLSLFSLQPKKQLNLIKIEHPINFYYLSLIKEEDTWSIHGLWPQYSVGKYPRFCHSADFDISALDPIIASLKQQWYSDRDDDEIFWEHEYLKHGTCNFNHFDELSYFKTTIELFDKAMALNLPEHFYNSETHKCLIPVNQTLDFFTIN
jgi:hypothetical protein